MRVRSEAGFTELYRAQYQAVFAFFLRRVDDPETARDLTAEAFRIAWVRWENERRPDRAWLLGVARNFTDDEYRRRRRDQDRLAAIGTDAASRPGADDAGAGVRAVVAGLPSNYREVLILTYWDGLSAAEASRVLGVSPAAVWVRLHRARRAFAAAWEAPFTTPSRPVQPEEAP